MTKKEFKIWLVTHDYTQKSLADTLKITDRTISNYVSNDRFPRIFVLALNSLSQACKLRDK